MPSLSPLRPITSAQIRKRIASWLTALRNDKRLIFTAASQAQKAADFLLATGSQEAATAALAGVAA